jgi:N-acetyl-anhydromuramyl-L-alanine amidase AmpD
MQFPTARRRKYAGPPATLPASPPATPSPPQVMPPAPPFPAAQPEFHPVPVPVPEPHPQFKAQTESQPEPEPEPWPDTHPESKPEPWPDPQPEPQAEPHPEILASLKFELEALPSEWSNPETTRGSDSPDAEGARTEAVHPANYRQANRPHDFPIELLVIHVTGRPSSEAVALYRDAPTGAPHYLVRADGTVIPLVREQDYALHSGHVLINQRSIAIEHEGAVDDPTCFTEAMYRASAALARTICHRYGIPMDRDHIIGQNEVPETSSTDPGIYWDWDRYMALVQQENAIVVDNANPLRFYAGASWRATFWNPQRYGKDYRLALPNPRGDAAWFRVPFPRSGHYQTFVWYPSNRDYCSFVPIILYTADGPQVIRVDQRQGGGRWMPLGTFPFQAGDYWAVAVSTATSAQGYVAADAFKFVPVN